MNKEETLAALSSVEESLKAIKNQLAGAKGAYVKRKAIRDTAQKVSRRWFEELENTVLRSGVDDGTVMKYHDLFDKLLQLSVTVSWRKTYVKTVTNLLQGFKPDLVVPVMKSAGPILGLSQLDRIMDNIQDAAERDYLTEAVKCADHEYFRASVVLGWNAAVHRMQRVVEKLGFTEFNKKSEEMKKISEGRYKRFNKSFNIHSIGELRATVFDTDLLWILEYWNLIDSNQHERLQTCFTMRSNCAHPGEAPITSENLASFYSDLKNMVFDNPKFAA